MAGGWLYSGWAVQGETQKDTGREDTDRSGNGQRATAGDWQNAQRRHEVAIVRSHSDSSEAEITGHHLILLLLSFQSLIIFWLS